MSARDRVREWLADHLMAIAIVLLVLWAPPIIFNVLVDLKVVDGAGSGYPTLRDPGLLISILQITLIAASLPSLPSRRKRGWNLLGGAMAMWFAYAAWTLQWRLRLSGVRDLASSETLLMLGAIAIASIVLIEVKSRFATVSRSTASQTTGQQPAGLRPDMM